jgi:hypothetical protein
MPRGNHTLLAFLLTVAATASACTVAVEQHPVPARPQACTFENAPVCARRGNQQRTFSNACMARASGFQVLHRGQCQMRPAPISSRPAACTGEFAPVCARRGSQQRTFNNACMARTSGFQVLHRGQCQVRTAPISSRPATCTREFAPVCAMRGSAVRTFNNACLARANGFRPIRSGRCR